MIKNYIKTAFRNLLKRKTFTLIHILGLGLAFGAAIILFLTAMFELSFDNFHVNKQQIGLLYKESNPLNGREYSENVPPPLGPALKSDIPSIEKISRFGSYGAVLRHEDKQFSVSARFVDPDFLEIFSFPTITGSSTQALNDPESVVISSRMAKNLYESTDVIGQLIELRIADTWATAQITAVLDEIPNNSSIDFDVLFRFEKMPGYQSQKNNWHHNNHSVFVQMAGEKLNPEVFQNQSRAFVAKHLASQVDNLKRESALPDKNGEYLTLNVLPLKDYHLNDLRIGGGGPPKYPWILILLAGLILFIAGSNFVNLSIANSFTRIKEIGMRKTLGGRPWQILMQLWGESLLLCLIALMLGAFIAWLLLPSFNANMNYHLSILQLLNGKNMILFLFGFGVLSLMAGGYPSWIISKVHTLTVLKGKLEIGKRSKLKNVLTVFQFSIATLLIMGTLIISNQLNYLHDRPLGFNQTEVISIPIGNEIDREDALKRMRVALSAYKEVESVSGTDINIGNGRDNSSSTSQLSFLHKDRIIRTNWLRVDYDFIETLELEMVAGRDFSRDFSTDTAAVIINEQMAYNFDDNPQNVVGMSIPINDEGMRVIGVVKDYNFQNLRNEIGPLTLFIDPSNFPLQYIFVRVSGENMAAILAMIEKEWKTINPKASMEASFLNENTAKQYERDKRFSNIVVAGATLAIVIACMGLFAVAMLSINQRFKEIGIRKILGANILGIVIMLSRDFVTLVFIGLLIGTPLAWWAGHKWLDTFAYRIDIGLGLILIGSSIIVFISLITVIIQSMRAAVANPVDSLRDE